MRFEDRLRDDLHAVPLIVGPRVGLADGVLAAMRRGRRRRHISVSAMVTALLVAIFGAGQLSTSDSSESTQMIEFYRTAEASYVLDEGSGKHRRLPFAEAALSPDGRTIAVSGTDGRLGLASRHALLRKGAEAVSWNSARGGGPVWSPDGKAVLVMDVQKSSDAVAFLARRYDVETAIVTETRLPANIIGQAAWAADSLRYLVLLARDSSSEGVVPGALQYVAPDGLAGPTIEVEGGEVIGFSLDRAYLLVDGSQLMSTKPISSKVIDLSTGRLVREFVGRPVGWSDRTHYAVLVRNQIQLIDVASGEVDHTIPLERGMRGLVSAAFAGSR